MLEFLQIAPDTQRRRVLMWKWAGDQRFCDIFAKLYPGEIVALIAYTVGSVAVSFLATMCVDSESVFAAVIRYLYVAWPYIGWTIVAFVVPPHIQMMCTAFTPSRFSFSNFLRIDGRVYAFLSVALLLYAGMIVFVPESINALFSSVKGIARGVSFFYFALLILKEEIVFRLFLYYSVNRYAGRTAAFFCSSIFFALSHQYSLYYPVAVLPAGMALSILTVLSGNLIFSIVFHAALNIIVYLCVVYRFPFL